MGRRRRLGHRRARWSPRVSRRRAQLRTGLIVGTVSAGLVIVAQVVTGALHPGGGTHAVGSLSIRGAPSVTNQLHDAGLVDGDSINAPAVRKLLAEIPATAAAPTTTYDRDSFGPAWADTDHNGCDQRNDVLARDLTAVTYKPGTHDCVVLTGTLADPYTGQEISFTHGSTTSTAVQIDHMVPLSWAYQHEASTWTEQRREQLATDLNNLTPSTVRATSPSPTRARRPGSRLQRPTRARTSPGSPTSCTATTSPSTRLTVPPSTAPSTPASERTSHDPDTLRPSRPRRLHPRAGRARTDPRRRRRQRSRGLVLR
ncbi:MULTISPECIES: DUF1524 domain-containing protein [unclassified Curtobacterium]|uniref:GmrSD restriction endonuclease domain-containing protein n=1 Tax=unclassified Curtobacterium TaxID=257496 RepID=UPI00288A525A|nr:DUF1524 domain-containing protein [Curtobacterium sp. PhB130]